MDDLVCKLDATTYIGLPKKTKVFNLNTLEHFVWIHLPDKITHDWALFEVLEIVPDRKSVCYEDIIQRDCGKPWLKVASNELNTNPGQHVYKLSFVNIVNNDVVSLYISYIIQDDNPDKSYVYMHR